MHVRSPLRGDGQSHDEVAASAGISAETLCEIETGHAPIPAFFTVAALAGALALSMDELAGRWVPTEV
ncbi:XRE family transcriptional regulator [Streptomyces sp. NBC_01615]|uniref:XRE family transcriptional regulator n=1 Tax=Streptomyces sp. NBC_01615 TaxID=2975898 RepID=UPI00386CC8CA